MKPVSYKRHRFPPNVIRHAVWLCFRFTLSLRDVEELLAQRAGSARLSHPTCGALVRHRPGAGIWAR
jgi:transposase-like protein